MEKEIIETKKRRWPKRLFLLGLFLALFVIYIHKLEPSFITTKEYAITNEKIPNSFNGFKIAHFSDIHFGRTTNEEEVKKVVEKINEMNPDIVVFTGDLFDPYITLLEENKEYLKEELGKIHSNLGNFAVLGDNDLNLEETFKNIMQEAGFQILEKNTPIYYKGNTPIYINGISSNQEINLSEINTKNFQITLCHEPAIFDSIYSKSDLVLAGHSLGGLVRLPFTNGLFTFDNTNNYILGEYEKENSKLIVSNGIGTENLSIRLGNLPTINLYRFYHN